MQIYYKIINAENLLQFSQKHPELRKEIEDIMKVHRSQEFNIDDFIKEATPYDGKIIIFIHKNDKNDNNKRVIAIARTINTSSNKPEYTISAVHVRSEYRGQKICQKIIQTLMDSYEQYTNFSLYVDKNNEAAITCYKKVGFIIKEIQDNDIHMIKKGNYKNYGNTKIDLILFMDLYQASQQIINMTNDNDIIILIGDTPSYMTPFIETRRQVYNLAFSNKPFGCFYPPHSKKYKIPVKLKNVFIPTKENEEKYFKYLDSKTFMTKKFVNENLNKLILVDSSSGQSISGVSIFLNRYISNIQNDQDCINIKGAQPIRFIAVTDYGYPFSTTNISVKQSEKIQNNWMRRNYNPKLIIYIGEIIFLHRNEFMINELYPRYIEEYSVNKWNKEPELLQKGKRNIELLRTLYTYYCEFNSNNFVNFSKMAKIIKNMSFNSIAYEYKDKQKIIRLLENLSVKNMIKIFLYLDEILLIKKYK